MFLVVVETVGCDFGVKSILVVECLSCAVIIYVKLIFYTFSDGRNRPVLRSVVIISP